MTDRLGDSELSWRRFADELGAIAQVPSEGITSDLRLAEDLELDSLAIAEVLVFLLDEYNPARLSRDLEDRVWERITVGELFVECTGEVPHA